MKVPDFLFGCSTYIYIYISVSGGGQAYLAPQHLVLSLATQFLNTQPGTNTHLYRTAKWAIHLHMHTLRPILDACDEWT